MKYDVFMWTRTFDSDYTWLNKPDYMPISVQGTCQSVITAVQNGSNNFAETDWYSGFYYLRVNGCCLLARVAKTVYTANDGQNIVSFEGVCVREEDEHHLFYNIPNVINRLFPPARSFRAKYEEQGAMDAVLEVDGVMKPFSTEISPTMHPAVKSNPAFINLLKFIAFSAKPGSFMFGKNMRALSEQVSVANLNITRIFDFDNTDKAGVDEMSFVNAYNPLNIEYTPPVATGRDKVAVNLLVQEPTEDKYRYRWVIMPWDSSIKDANRVRYSTKFYDIGDRVELARLELQKESIRKYLLDNGWTKQPIGLRFEKDVFEREVKS
ncbi:MAG: hypothetical protein FWD35_03390 [Oscillospiraceae bacterium]|nr:hypothetical protein [Oscillospiraceae bacterium]